MAQKGVERGQDVTEHAEDEHGKGWSEILKHIHNKVRYESKLVVFFCFCFFISVNFVGRIRAIRDGKGYHT